MGLTFDLGTLQGFYDYYATPYLIWANAAAKEILGDDFTGDGGDFSPCFLMPKVFDLCGWTGPAFMQLARQVREVTPLVHERGLYLYDGQITDALPRSSRTLSPASCGRSIGGRPRACLPNKQNKNQRVPV